MHPIFESRIDFDTAIPAPQSGSPDESPAGLGLKHHTNLKLLNPLPTVMDRLISRQGQQQISIAAGCSPRPQQGGPQRPADIIRHQAFGHDRPDDPGKLMLPLPAMGLQPPAATNVFDMGGQVGQLMQQCDQKGVRVQVIIDGDPVPGHSGIRRPMIPEFRHPAGHHPQVNLMLGQQFANIAGSILWQTFCHPLWHGGDKPRQRSIVPADH